MKTKQKGRIVVSILALASLVAFSLMGYAGSLEPSAAPAPTMKTLDEVEPRVPIHASDLPLTITEPNSYYLVEDVDFTDDANNAITIECNDVTIDLMGYTLKGPGPMSIYGIYLSARTNVEIRNGTIRDFYYGIYDDSSSGTQHRVVNVRAMSNRTGIRLYGAGNLIKDCMMAKNYRGVFVGDGSTVTGNTASDNSTYGVCVNAGCTVTGNTAYNNDFDGIYAGSGCTMTGNTAYGNGTAGIYADTGSTVTGNTCYDNGSAGIYAGNGSTVTGNTAYGNDDYGILAHSGCTVTGNMAYQNNQSDNTAYAGIRVENGCLVKANTTRDNTRNNIRVDGWDNAIEENLLTNSSNGIYFGWSGNFYANNRASGNTTDYNDVAGGQTNGGGNFSF